MSAGAAASSLAEGAANTDAQTLRDAIHAGVNAGVQAVLQEVSSRRGEADAAVEAATLACAQMRASAEEEATQMRAVAWEEVTQMGVKAREEAAQVGAEAREEAARMTEGAQAGIEELRNEARAARDAVEAEKASMEQAHTFQRNKIALNVGGHRFKTSLQTLTSVPDSYFGSLFSGRFEQHPDAEGVYFIDRDGTHFRHILNHLRDPGSFTLSPAMPYERRAEIIMEFQFYGLLDRVMPYYGLEHIGVSLLKQACTAGTKHALQAAVAQARALAVEMGSTTPWLIEEFQDTRYLITEVVINDVPVWVEEDGTWSMYLSVDNTLWISDIDMCAKGEASGYINHPQEFADSMAPTMLPSTGWMSNDTATLASKYASAGGTDETPWVDVPAMRVTAVHGLPDDDPAMAAALRQLAALT